eukprot:6116802-Prymnesium_polylepis.1
MEHPEFIKMMRELHKHHHGEADGSKQMPHARGRSCSCAGRVSSNPSPSSQQQPSGDLTHAVAAVGRLKRCSQEFLRRARKSSTEELEARRGPVASRGYADDVRDSSDEAPGSIRMGASSRAPSSDELRRQGIRTGTLPDGSLSHWTDPLLRDDQPPRSNGGMRQYRGIPATVRESEADEAPSRRDSRTVGISEDLSAREGSFAASATATSYSKRGTPALSLSTVFSCSDRSEKASGRNSASRRSHLKC